MVEISICVGSAFHLKESYEVIDKLKCLVENDKLKDKIIIKVAFCLLNCTESVPVQFNNKVHSVSPENVEKFYCEVVKKQII